MSIDLNLSADQREILSSAGRLLEDRFAPARLRGPHAATADHALLPLLADIGVLGLGCPEADGGAGFGVVEDAQVGVLLGRHLVTPHALAASLGARMARALGRTALAADMLAGRCRVCIANALAPFDLQAPDGTEVHLLDPQGAALALLWNDAGMLLLDVAALAARPVTATDPSVPLQRCRPSGAAVAGRLEASAHPLPQLAHLLLSAQLLGMAEACRDMACAYAQVREQFGRPIGAFQAVKHRCADMAIRAAALRAQLTVTAIAVRDGWGDAGFQVDACRLLAARYALDNAAANIQLHGGMGFTAECDAHLYLLRAHLYEHLGGPRAAVRARMVGGSGATDPSPRSEPCV